MMTTKDTITWGGTMERFVALRDRRLQGGVPVTPQLETLSVDTTVPLAEAFTAIVAAAGNARIRALFLLCHGYAGQDRNARVSVDAGGMGLELCTQGVRHYNVDAWRAIRDKVEDIVVYSCAAADTQRDNIGTAADGRYLMGALALHTNATVYAADRIQWYRIELGIYNFGAWEGTLLRFSPNGAAPTAVRRAPIELSDVLNGSV